VAYGNFILTGSPWSIAFTLGLAIAIILLLRALFPASQRHFDPLPLPTGTLANATLKEKYLNPPQGELYFDGVKFFIGPDTYLFDTSQARLIEADGTVKAELKLPEPKKIESVHLLINAGGGYRIEPNSKTPLEWLKIGRVSLIFKDKTSQDTNLILGSNVREWAIGNFPGQLVDRVDDCLSQVAWRGKNTSGNYAVIDQLEIPILESNKNKMLESIVFIRDISRYASPSEGGNLHFLVSGVTLESKRVKR
jgi:hypothetical protein